MREKPQRKRPNKKTAGQSEARKENRPDRRKEAEEKPSKIILSLAIMRLLKP